MPSIQDLEATARTLRGHAVRMVHRSKASHLGSCLSLADIVTALYWHAMRIDPSKRNDPGRDRFILSKGHAAAILYSALAEKGFFPVEELDRYCEAGSRLTGHATSGVPGVEFSSGSLGHGLPVACGLALAAKRDGLDYRTFVVLSDGELDEGSNWEALLFAPQHQLDNLVVIVDYNKIQSFGRVSDVLELEPLADKFQSFRWAVKEVDGHNLGDLTQALDALPFQEGVPSLILAHTVKGKGVSFMEDQLAWHYKSPTAEQVLLANEELEVAE